MWTRRAFLAAAGAGFAGSLLPAQAEALDAAEHIFASAVLDRSGGYSAALLTANGEIVHTLRLPARGHDVAFTPDGVTGAVFARRPGTFAVIFDTANRTTPRILTSPEGRHFFGHGAFSADGKLLYATENDIATAQGLIGIYDIAGGYRRIGEFPTHGIGPHEAILLPDGITLAVANGGIETNPAFGRALLNLAGMDPSLSFIDTRDGALLGQLRLPAELHRLSIRHLAVDSHRQVWFGCQYEGGSEQRPQLVGRATLEGEIELVDLPLEHLARLRNFVGGISASKDGARIAVSSPEGGAILVLDARTLAVVRSIDLVGGGGVAPCGKGFLASSGRGQLLAIPENAPAPDPTELPFTFDSHLRAV